MGFGVPQMLQGAVCQRDSGVLLPEDTFQELGIGPRKAVFKFLVLGFTGIPLSHGARMQVLIGV